MQQQVFVMTILALPTDSALTKIVIAQVNARLADLTPGDEYTLANILGDDFWDKRPTLHRAMGQSFSKLVTNGRTPFTAAELTQKRHNQYYFTG